MIFFLFFIEILLFKCEFIKEIDIISASGIPLFVFFLCCMIGGFFVIEFSYMLSNVSKKYFMINFIGKNSLYFYIFHTVGVMYISNTNGEIINWIIGIALSFLVPLVFIFMSERTFLGKVLF